MAIPLRKHLNFYLGMVRLAIAGSVLPFTAAVFGQAQTPQPPYALFQYSTLTGSGNTITATQIPIITAGGNTIYTNMILQFDVDPSGNLSISSGYPQLAPSPALQVSSFVAGRYVGPSTLYSGGAAIIISGPGVTDGGATEWSLAAAPGANGCTYPASATWYAGPIAASPLAARIKSAGITSTAWSYGIGGSQCGTYENSWSPHSLFGVSQIGNTLTFVSFTSYGKDGASPVDQITYTLAPQAGSSQSAIH